MTVSLPSREVFSLSVPAVKAFDAEFHYGFFTPDEQLTDLSSEARKYAQRPAEDFDSNFIQIALSRVPRSVILTFSHSHLTQVDNQVTQTDIRAHATRELLKSSKLISDNLDKIVTEDHLTFQSFVGVNFHDGEIDSKVYDFVSGSYLQRTLDENVPSDISHYRASLALATHTPDNVKPSFLSKALNVPSQLGVKVSAKKTSQQTSKKGTGKLDKQLSSKLKDSFFDELKSFSINAQLNARMIQDVIGRAIKDPHNSSSSDMEALHIASRTIQRNAIKRFVPGISDDEFKTVVPFVKLVAQRASHPQRTTANVVGYIVEKIEILDNGHVKTHDPIIIENGNASTTLDVRVRYGARYGYTIKTIVQLTLPVNDETTGASSTAHILVSSRQSNTVYVYCHEDIAPDYPSDFNFTWNYENEKLMLHWSFPPTPQRDIKKFQVFRREVVDDPFELVKEYDFDDSLNPSFNAELPSAAVVEKLKNPAAFFVDDDFSKGKSFIYALGSVVAHGMVSSYSAQFEIGFDVFKNKLTKKLISHGGAPRPYPNMYLEGELFTETIRDQGHQRMKLYFNPEFYQMYDDSGRVTPVLATNKTNGVYKLSFINVDIQKQRFLTVTVDDRTKRET